MTHTTAFFLAIVAVDVLAFVAILRNRPGAGRLLLGAGALLDAAFLAAHSTVAGEFLWNALVDPPFVIPLLATLVLLRLEPGALSRRSLALAVLLVAAAHLFAAFYPKGIIPPAANKSGLWPFLFFVFENAAHALFGVAAVLAASEARQPSRTIRRLVVVGFVAFSLAQVVGAWWSFLGWGHPFLWGARHLSSASVWLVYAALIHRRFLSTFPLSERWLTVGGGLLATYVAYSHLVFEMGIPRVRG